LTRGARALLADLVDYAGLFPPAGLAMAEATEQYAAHLGEPAAWMLGRFVVPAARLDELERVADPLWAALGAAGKAPSPGPGPGSGAPDGGPDSTSAALGPAPWRLSALVGPALEAHAEAVSDFNVRHTGRARVETVELTAHSAVEAEAALAVLPPGLLTYVEVPLAGDPDPILGVLKRRRARAKVRTGGVAAEAIPGPAPLARFLEACARVRVAFKATAGLHHPVRAEHPLTYERGAPRATMHGFLNVFTAAGLARAGLDATALEAVLRETDPSAFRLDDSGLAWRDRRLDPASLAALRRDFAASFGSCSFAEPVADLRALGAIA